MTARPKLDGRPYADLRFPTAGKPPRRAKTACSGEAIASARNANASAKLLLPVPFCPTRKVGLSNSTTSAGRLWNCFKIRVRRIGSDMGIPARCPFQLDWSCGCRQAPAWTAHIMPSVTANHNGICGQSCVDQFWTCVDGIQCGGLSELQSCNSEICRNATRLQFISCPALKNQAHPQPTPSPPHSTRSHTPPAPTSAQPPAKPRSPTTHCKAESGPTPAPPVPTTPPPADRARVHGIPLPSPTRPLPPCPSAGH